MPVAEHGRQAYPAANHLRVGIQWAKTKKREMSEANGGKQSAEESLSLLHLTFSIAQREIPRDGD